jgi:hypothetical protein
MLNWIRGNLKEKINKNKDTKNWRRGENSFYFIKQLYGLYAIPKTESKFEKIWKWSVPVQSTNQQLNGRTDKNPQHINLLAWNLS